MEELLQAQLNAQRAGVSYAVVTIAEASGSVPRTSGKMLVYADGHSLGTIGGGPAERRAKADALAQLDAGQNAFLHYDFPTPGGASCAGRLSILIEVFQPKPLLVVFGGGHVGTSLLRLAAPTGFRTLLLDDRAGDQIPDAVSLASRFVCIQNVERDILNTPIPEHAFFVLCGHDHAVDGEALAAALQKSPKYIGMLASRQKIQSLFRSSGSAGLRTSSSRLSTHRLGWTWAARHRRSLPSAFWRSCCSSKTEKNRADRTNHPTEGHASVGCFYSSLRISAISSGV